MEFKVIALDEELLSLTAPPYIIALLGDARYETILFGGFEEGDLACYAVFSHLPEGDARDVYLEYLYTAPDFRGQGRSAMLLKACRKRLKDMGIRAILSKTQLEPEYAMEYHEFLTKRGFLPLNLTDRLLYYHLLDLERAQCMQLIMENLDRLPPVAALEEAGEKRVWEFLKDKGKTEASLKESDHRYSRFYLDGRRISAALTASALDEDTLYVSGVYLDDFAKQSNVFLELFSSCVESAKQELGENMDLYFLVGDEDTYQGLLRVFVPPEEEYLVLEHMLALNLEEG